MTQGPAVEVIAVQPGSAEGRAVLTAYFADIVGRYHRRQATQAEVARAMRDEPSDDLSPPRGLLLVARQGSIVIGCAGLRLLPGGSGIGEVTRLYVAPAARRRGVGRRLLAAIEDAARGHGLHLLRLDTRRDLNEARQLYATSGYREVDPFTEGRYVDHCFQKALA